MFGTKLLQDFTIWLKILLTLTDIFFLNWNNYFLITWLWIFYMSNETLNTNVALYAKTMVHYLIHEYVSLADAKLLPVQLRTSYYPVQFRWCLLTCDEMLCFSFWIRSSLRLPKVPATLEILRSITLSSGHLHVRSKMQKSIQILASIHNKMYFYVEIDLHEIVAHGISQSQFTSYIVN